MHYPETGLICIENTHNRAGGAIVPVKYMRDIYTIAQTNYIPVHVDGARLFNASAALNIPVTEFTQHLSCLLVYHHALASGQRRWNPTRK